jgi:hypothetical protein
MLEKEERYLLKRVLAVAVAGARSVPDVTKKCDIKKGGFLRLSLVGAYPIKAIDSFIKT